MTMRSRIAVANEGIGQRNWYLARVGFALRFDLVKPDTAVAKAAVRQLTKRTGGLLTVLVGLPVLAMIARAWLNARPDNHRDRIAYGVSALIATVVSKALLERAWFHHIEGELARFAQRPGDWLSHTVLLLVAGILVGF